MNSHPITRRTAVTGAAWSVPAVAVAAAAPAYASSVTLAFQAPVHAGCTTIDYILLKAPLSLAGQTITLTLSNGYTFRDSGTTTIGVPASTGFTLCPPVRVNSDGSRGTLSASIAGLQASTQVAGTTQSTSTYGSGDVGITSLLVHHPPTMQEVTALGGAFSLAGTTLRRLDSERATNVARAFGYSQPGDDDAAAFIGTDGVARTTTHDGVIEEHPTVPLNATPLGASFFLAGTDLYHRNTLVSSNIAAAHGYVSLTGGAALATVIRTNGAAALIDATNDTVTARVSVPLNATPLAGDYWLAGTYLYYGNTRIAQGIRAAVAYATRDDSAFEVDCLATTGAACIAGPAGIIDFFTAVGLNPTPVGGGHFLGGGNLYWRDTAVISGGKVLRARGGGRPRPLPRPENFHTVTFVSNPC